MQTKPHTRVHTVQIPQRNALDASFHTNIPEAIHHPIISLALEKHIFIDSQACSAYKRYG